VMTVFPTKLALAPRLAQRVMEELNIEHPASNIEHRSEDEEPQVARPPWEREGQWFAAR